MVDERCWVSVAAIAAAGAGVAADELDEAMPLGCCAAVGDAAGAGGLIASGAPAGREYEVRSQAATPTVKATIAQVNCRFIYPSVSRTPQGVLVSVLVRFLTLRVEREVIDDLLTRHGFASASCSRPCKDPVPGPSSLADPVGRAIGRAPARTAGNSGSFPACQPLARCSGRCQLHRPERTVLNGWIRCRFGCARLAGGMFVAWQLGGVRGLRWRLQAR
jgi:hypothetical protein